MDNIFTFKTKQEDSAVQKHLTEVNELLASRIGEIVRDIDNKLRDRKLELEGVLGSGIFDFVIASLLMYNASYFLNKLSGKTLNLEVNFQLDPNELDNLASMLLQRLLTVERERFEKHSAEVLKDTPLFRRIKKKAKDNLAYLKNYIKKLETNDT